MHFDFEQFLIEGFCLADGSGEAIEDKSVFAYIFGPDSFDHHLDGDSVWDEFSSVDIAFGELSEIGFGVHFGSEDHSGREWGGP